MTNYLTRRPSICVMLMILAGVVSASVVCADSAAQREHLTPEEIEIVRDTQELDRRTAVFVKAVERRMMVLTNSADAAPAKKKEKDEEKWGALPKGTRVQLLSDISRILDEAITNIDDSALKSAQSPLLAKSLRKLAEASKSFLPTLTAMRGAAAEEAEREALEQAIEEAQTVIEAAAKLPPDEKKK